MEVRVISEVADSSHEAGYSEAEIARWRRKCSSLPTLGPRSNGTRVGLDIKPFERTCATHQHLHPGGIPPRLGNLSSHSLTNLSSRRASTTRLPES